MDGSPTHESLPRRSRSYKFRYISSNKRRLLTSSERKFPNCPCMGLLQSGQTLMFVSKHLSGAETLTRFTFTLLLLPLTRYMQPFETTYYTFLLLLELQLTLNAAETISLAPKVSINLI